MMSSVSVGFPLARCLFVCGWRFQFSGQSRWPVAKGGLGSGLRIPGLRTCPSSFRLSGDIYDTLPAAAEVPNKCNLNWGIPPVNTISVVEVVWVGMTSRINSRKCHYSNSLKEQEVSIHFQLRDVHINLITRQQQLDKNLLGKQKNWNCGKIQRKICSSLNANFAFIINLWTSHYYNWNSRG